MEGYGSYRGDLDDVVSVRGREGEGRRRGDAHEIAITPSGGFPRFMRSLPSPTLASKA